MKVPLEHLPLFRDNILPSRFQVQYFTDLLSKQEQKLTTFDEDIEFHQRSIDDSTIDETIKQRHQHSLNNLQGQRKRALYDFNLTRCVLAPVRKLPEEILREIFKWATLPYVSARQDEVDPDVISIDYAPDISWSTSPLNLLGVCTTWQRAALDMRSLFQQIILNGRSDKVPPRSIFNIWLRYSGDLPLDICICPDEWCDQAFGQEFGQAIIPHLHRIRTFVISTERFAPTLFLQDTQTQAPMLEYLRIYEQPESELPLHIQTLGGLDAPKLIQYYIYGDQVVEWNGALNFGEHLTTYHSPEHIHGTQDLLRLLKNCHMLVTCDVLCVDEDDDEEEGEEMAPGLEITLPFLQYFTLRWLEDGSEVVAKVISNLKLPAVRELKMKPNDNSFSPRPGEVEPTLAESLPTHEIPDAIRTCIVGSGADIRVFGWNGTIDESTEIFLELLEAMPRLERLELSEYILHGHVIDILNRDLYPDICPKLSQLDLVAVYLLPSDSFGHPLCDAIVSRVETLNVQKGETLLVDMSGVSRIGTEPFARLHELDDEREDFTLVWDSKWLK